MGNNLKLVEDQPTTIDNSEITGGDGIKMQSNDGGGGGGMEARIAKLEANVSHIQGDVTDIKSDTREIKRDARWDFRLLFGTIIATALGLAWLIAKSANWI